MNRALLAPVAAAGLVGAAAVPARALSGSVLVGELRVELTSAPDRPTVGQKTLYTTRLVRADGAPLTGACDPACRTA